MNEALMKQVRFGLRNMLALLLLMGVVLGSAAIWFALSPAMQADTTRLPIAAKVLLLLTFAVTVFQVAIHAIVRQPAQHYRLRSAAIATTACGLLIALAGMFWWSITYDLGDWLAVLPRIALTLAAVMPAMILSCAWLAAKERPRLEAHQQWQALELDS